MQVFLYVVLLCLAVVLPFYLLFDCLEQLLQTLLYTHVLTPDLLHVFACLALYLLGGFRLLRSRTNLWYQWNRILMEFQPFLIKLFVQEEHRQLPKYWLEILQVLCRLNHCNPDAVDLLFLMANLSKHGQQCLSFSLLNRVVLLVFTFGSPNFIPRTTGILHFLCLGLTRNIFLYFLIT